MSERPQTTGHEPSQRNVAADRFSLERGRAIRFVYRNWRGDVAERRVEVAGVEWGSTERRPDPGWLLSAYDLDRGDYRLFAMQDMSEVRRDYGE